MAVYDAWWTGDLDARLPGGESAHDVRNRFLPALDGILDGASGDVVLVSHGAAIRLAAAALLGDTAETRFLPNTGIVVLRPENGRWALEHWDGAVPVRGDVTAGGAPA
jgi:probable phosphoglycerate mutase